MRTACIIFFFLNVFFAALNFGFFVAAGTPLNAIVCVFNTVVAFWMWDVLDEEGYL